MKILVMYVNEFSYKPAIKNLETADDNVQANTFQNAIVAFIQVEADDEEQDVKSREKKLVNHLKWTARKNDCNHIVLHSFAHLSESKASPEFTKATFDAAQERLKNVDYQVEQTPFGYFLDLKIDAPGKSLARIWKSL